MSRRHWRTNRVLAVGLLVAVLVVLLFALVRVTTFINPNPVRAAWQLARQAGNYHFAADIVQTTLPRVTVTNAGRRSRQDTLRLEGEADLQAQTMHLRLWSQGGSPLLPESGAEVQVANGTTYARQGGSAWEEVNDFTGLFAPAGDFLSYLAGVRNIQDAGSEARAGVRFTRYTFDLNGPVFAEYMREQLQQQMAAEGKLPPGLSFDAPRMFAEMTGEGELWVRTDGLPLRQILRLQFPEQGGEQVSGEITVSFAEFAPLPAFSSERLAQALQMGLQNFATHVPTGIALGLMLMLAGAMIRWRHSRRLGTVLAVVLCGIILSEPVLMNLRVAAFGATRQAEAAEQAAQRTQTELQREALAQQGRPAVDPHADPLAPAPTVTEGLGGGMLAAIEPGGIDSGIDTDGDGLTDFQEARLGTSSSAADANADGQPDGRDSDGDGVSDNDEVRGFTFGGRRWYSDPLDADTNNDGIGDGPEWNGSFATTWDRDGDGTPDIYDSDNDNDGVPDRLDISPAQGPQRSGTTNVTYGPDTPFTFQINNLRANTSALVDFQLRPTNPDHLWYAFNVLDWPQGDQQGTIMDNDGGTFHTVFPDSQNPANADGDMRLLPTLEIRISTEGGAPTNLPLTDTVALPLEPLGAAGVQGTVRLTQNGGSLGVDATVAPQASVTGLTLLEGRCASLPQTLPAPDNRTVSASGGTINTTLRDLLIRRDNGLVSRINYAVVARSGNTAVACGDIPLLAYEGDRLIDNALLGQYGIFVRDAQADGIDKLVYVPLQLVTDPETGARVAFKARMFYQSRGVWARVHTARLVWSVQVLQDVCRTFANNQCSQFSHFNIPQVVQTYHDEWYITGLHVREDHGADLALAYADPTVADPSVNNNRQADLALTAAAEGLARTYLQGANLTMEELRNRLDHMLNGTLPVSSSWGLRTNATTNVLRVVTRTGYPHLDALIADVATSRPGQRSASQAILEDVFSSYGANNFDLNPTLLFIRSERFRAANLDAVGSNAALIGGQLTLNMPTSGSTSIPVQEVRTINWALYRYLGASGDDPQWAALSTEEHLAAIATRYPAAGIPVSYLDPDPANNAQEQAARLLQFQLYHLAIQRGLQSTVRVDTTLLTNPVPDNAVNDLFQTILTNQFSYAAFEFFFGLLFELEDEVSATAAALTDAIEAVSTLLERAREVGDLGELVSLIKPDSWRSVLSGIASLAGLATVLSGVLIILASTVFVLAEQNLATQIAVSIIIGGIQLLTLVVKPIYDAIQTLREVAAATQSTTFVAQNGVWASPGPGRLLPSLSPLSRLL